MENNTYYLYLDTWVNQDNWGARDVFSKGSTMMLNDRGNSCCLGQFALQRRVGYASLLGRVNPSSVGAEYDENFCTSSSGVLEETQLARDLMCINDSVVTLTDKRRAELIRQRMRTAGLTLIVKNENSE